MADVARLYRDQCRFPSVSRADVGPVILSRDRGQHFNIYSEWTQRDLERKETVKFCRQYAVFLEDGSVGFSGPSGTCTELKGELLSSDSPSGRMKAVLRESGGKEEQKQYLEIWHKNSKMKCVNLTALKKHGQVYEDSQFGCLVWSLSETHLLYVAEKKRQESKSYFQKKPVAMVSADENKAQEVLVVSLQRSVCLVLSFSVFQGKHFEYHEDWGEDLVGKSIPVMCVLDMETGNITVLEGIPEGISPGQGCWSPGDTGLVFVGWKHEPFRLGLKYCSNRRSALYYLDLDSGECEQLTDSSAVCSPRLSPDQSCIVYLESATGGPLQQCKRLCMFDWCTKKTRVVVDVVQRPREDGFTGIYCSALAPLCWSQDSQRVLLSTAQRSRMDLLVVDMSSGDVTCLTSGSQEGSWTLLNIRSDLMVVSCSSPNCPPDLRVGLLPGKEYESKTSWVTLEEAHPQSDISWRVLSFSPLPEQDNSQYPGLDFEAVLLKPAEVSAETKHPLIVHPHGGPHSVLVSEWILSTAVLCQMGFSVLLVNYRGSLGFGQDSILSLPGKIGTQDVRDVQFAVESVLKLGGCDERNLAVIGGSHGGFLACHLIGQYPDFYRTCVARNPVTNLISMLGSTDVPDWCAVESGLKYTTDLYSEPSLLEQMWIKSPIRHVSRANVLLLLGEDDRRVPVHQGLEFYRVIKNRKVPVRLLWYPGNNHALLEVEAESDAFMNSALWIIQHLV